MASHKSSPANEITIGNLVLTPDELKAFKTPNSPYLGQKYNTPVRGEVLAVKDLETIQGILTLFSGVFKEKVIALISPGGKSSVYFQTPKNSCPEVDEAALDNIIKMTGLEVVKKVVSNSIDFKACRELPMTTEMVQ